MMCPVCESERAYWENTNFTQNGDDITAQQNYYCPNCESSFYIEEYFKLDIIDPIPTVTVEGNKANFEPWFH